jgi:hypothetical protein
LGVFTIRKGLHAGKEIKRLAVSDTPTQFSKEAIGRAQQEGIAQIDGA